jgi:hypothetical protein
MVRRGPGYSGVHPGKLLEEDVIMSGQVWVWIVVAIIAVAVVVLVGMRLARRDRSPDPTVADALAPPPHRAGQAPAGGERTSEHAAVPGPYQGSVLPASDGSFPADEFPVKATTHARRYYQPGSPSYLHANADLWFRSAADAEAAGFTPARET